jgi:tripartite-type tricarboxylate transporter receptor subunit TctC
VLFGRLPASLPAEKSGRLRIPAVAGAKRSALLPDPRTIAEAALRGDVEKWRRIAERAGVVEN